MWSRKEGGDENDGVARKKTLIIQRQDESLDSRKTKKN